MRICPFDCTICIDPTCRFDGCKQTGEIMLEVCSDCGEPFTPMDCLTVCVTCLRSED